MFTKKHYEAIAKIIKGNTTTGTGLISSYGLLPWMNRDSFVYELADYFLKDNPNFDREKFIKACLGGE